MTKFKHLLREIHDAESLTPRDVYNFYYLWHTAVNNPQSVETQYGKEILNYYLDQFKAKYVKLFTRIMAKQIAKYVARKRVDADFPSGQNLDTANPETLLGLMKKTLRSDMQRRNDKWEMVGEFLINLAKANSAKDKFLWINQINNAVHNTQTRVMDKLPNYHSELTRAFGVVDKAKNADALRQFVDKDIRDLRDQEHEMTEGVGKTTVVWTGTISEGLEKIVMSPHMLAQLDVPTAPASTFATDKPAFIQPPEGEGTDDRDAGGNLKDLPIAEEDDFDFYGNLGKKIDASTPHGKQTGIPLIKKPVGKPSDDDKQDDKFKLGALQEEEDFDFYGNKGKKIDASTPMGKSTNIPTFSKGNPSTKKPEDKGKTGGDTDQFKLGALQEALKGSISDEDRQNVAFMSGLKLATNDKVQGKKRNLSGYPSDFVRGYKMVGQEGFWSKFNDKLTQWAASFGSSYGRRF